MEKKIKYGKVDLPEEAFDDANAMAHISIRLPLLLVKDLKTLALTEEFGGKYQVLIRSILEDYVTHQKKPKRKRA